MKTKTRVAILVGIITFFLSVAAFGQSPVLYQGNPNCSTLGFNRSYKIDPPVAGVDVKTFPSVGTLTTTINSNGSVNFLSAPAFVRAFIVKGGPNANVYFYDPASAVGNGLVTPLNDNGQPYGLSHVEMCYQLQSSAAQVSVRGRVLTGYGIPLQRGIVTLTNSEGNSDYVYTNSFGYYRFDNLPVGSIYTLNVRAKGYTFDPQVLMLSEEMYDFNILAQEQ